MSVPWAASVAVLLTLPAETPPDQREPSVAGGSEGFVAAWVERRVDGTEVVYAESSELPTFSAPFPASGPLDGDEEIRPSVAMSGRRAVITWADASRGDHDVYAAISDDAGRSFSPPLVVAGGPGGQVDPRAAVLPDGRVAISFHDSFGSSGDAGKVLWRARVVVSDAAGRFGPSTALGGAASYDRFDLFTAVAITYAAADPELGVVWLREGVDGSTAIEVARSVDLATSSDAARIDLPMGRHLRPRLAGTTRGFVAVFPSILDAEGQRAEGLAVAEAAYADVLVATSTGAAFGAPTILNTTRALTQHQADVAARGARVAVVWVDHSSPAVRRLVLRRSTDGGQSFGAEEVVVEGERGAELARPSVAISDDAIVIVYEHTKGQVRDVATRIVR